MESISSRAQIARGDSGRFARGAVGPTRVCCRNFGHTVADPSHLGLREQPQRSEKPRTSRSLASCPRQRRLNCVRCSGDQIQSRGGSWPWAGLSELLTLGIGLCVIYGLLGVMVSTVQEIVSGWLSVRASSLDMRLRSLLADQEVKKHINEDWGRLKRTLIVLGISKPDEKSKSELYKSLVTTGQPFLHQQRNLREGPRRGDPPDWTGR